MSSKDNLCLKPSVLLAREFAILVTLSFLITVEADALTDLSLERRVEIPGKGRISRLQTSVSSASNRARSILQGDRNDSRVLVDKSECERLMFSAVASPTLLCMTSLVFFNITWYKAGLGQLVVALRTESRVLIVLNLEVNAPKLVMSMSRKVYAGDTSDCFPVRGEVRRARHSSSSLGLQAVIMISNIR